ncbi:MAG: M56 family metallopeptidase [Myxococcota bacterium]
MTVVFGWLQIAVIIVAAGVLSGAVVSALVTSAWMDRIRAVAPRARFALLVGLALLPVVLGAAFLLVIFAPSVLDAAGLVQDHCAAHSHHAFHLCFVHDKPPAMSPLILGTGIIIGLWLAAGWSQNLGRLRSSNSIERALRDITEYDADTDSWQIDSERPVAMTLGILNPRVYVSDRLRGLLTSDQLDAVVAHEQAHARHFDALVKYMAALGADLQLPHVARLLLEEIDIACEQACDAAAADAVGDRLTVAETILAVERAAGDAERPTLGLGFAGEAIEARVRGLLEPAWTSLHWSVVVGTAALISGSTVLFYDSVHHAAETLLSYVL